ncbi:MAG: hypothetical protein ACI81T_002960 [Bacteroidia bacterium]
MRVSRNTLNHINCQTTTIVYENEYYKIEIDKAKNYLVIKPIGFWRSPELVPYYLNHIADAIRIELNPKFAVILDTSDMLTHPKEVQEKIHLEGLKLIIKFKPLVWVKVLPENDIIAIMQSGYLARILGTSKDVKAFSTMEEAERI